MYMSRIPIYLVIILLSLFVVGCTKVDESKVDNRTELIDNRTEVEDNTVIIEKKPIHDDGGLVKEFKFDGLKDQSLVPIGEDYTGMGQTPFNVLNEENMVLLCHDPMYNVTYYVNYGEDYYIYRIKEGKKELLVELSARRLFVKDGNLYFILDSYDKYQFEGVKEGNVLCYNPLTGKITVVIDDNVNTMILYDEGIYFKTIGKGTEHKDEITGKVISSIEEKRYFYSFEMNETVSIDSPYMDLMKWKQYHIQYDVVELGKDAKKDSDAVTEQVVGLSLTTLDQSESIPLIDEFFYQYIIDENKLYTLINSRSLLIVNLDTMEKEEIPLIMSQSGTYTKVDDKIYFSEFMVLDLTSKEQSIIKQPLSQIEGIDLTNYTEEELRSWYQGSATVQVRELYTDGNGIIYGICMEPGSFNYKMKRLDLTQASYGPLTMNNDKGIPYQVLRYEVSIEPMVTEVENEN